MEGQLSLHLKAFNNKVKVMNQSNARDMTLTKTEAQNLQADIFDLLALIADLTADQSDKPADAGVISVGMDGGGF